MKCPECGETLQVKAIWKYNNKIVYRQRRCSGCGHRMTTKERECKSDEWKPKKAREWDKKRATELYREGLMISEIARAVCQPYHVVYKYAEKEWYGK